MGLASTIRQWRADWARAHELDGLDGEQRDALARDIGIPEDVLVDLAARSADAGAELPRLMDALSLDAVEVRRTQAALMREMSITCSRCDSVSRCRRDLEDGRASFAYEEYCPNAEPLQELQGRRG